MPTYGPAPQSGSYGPQAPPRYYDQSHRGAGTDYIPDPIESRRFTSPGYLRKGDQVEVRVRGNIWIIGFLVSSLHLISSYFGHGYDVEYKDSCSGQAFQGAFREEDVRPIHR